MRSTCRLLLATLLLVTAAGIATAQDPSPPPAPNPVATPVPVLPPLPVDPNTAPPVEPPPGDPANPPVVAPQTPPVENPPAIEPPAPSAPAQSTRKKVSTTSRKTRKPVETAPKAGSKPQDKAAEAAAATTVVEPPSNLPPSGTFESVAPAETVAESGPPLAAADPSAGETAVEGAKTKQRTGIVNWILGALVLLGLAGIVTFFLRRRGNERISIYDRTAPARTRPI